MGLSTVELVNVINDKIQKFKDYFDCHDEELVIIGTDASSFDATRTKESNGPADAIADYRLSNWATDFGVDPLTTYRAIE